MPKDIGHAHRTQGHAAWAGTGAHELGLGDLAQNLWLQGMTCPEVSSVRGDPCPKAGIGVAHPKWTQVRASDKPTTANCLACRGLMLRAPDKPTTASCLGPCPGQNSNAASCNAMHNRAESCKSLLLSSDDGGRGVWGDH